MNYFELFEIPVSFSIDKTVLTKKLLALQRQYHPDKFANGSDAEKDAALEKSSLVNNAYKTFQSKDETIKYILQLFGHVNDQEKFVLPPDFLMEVLSLNELKMNDDDADTFKERTIELQTEEYEAVKLILESKDNHSPENSQLLKVKEYYYKKKYLDRLLQDE